MSIIISNIRYDINDSEEIAINKAISKLKVKKTLVKKAHIYKKSLDARRKGNFSFVASVVIELTEKEAEIVKAISDPFVMYKEKLELEFCCGIEQLKGPIVIIGFGPAGIFAAYTLAKLGYNPIVFEQGGDIDSRVNSVNRFWTLGQLDEKCNVQFGEGGAGTFSDGKLTTRISDNRCEYVLEEFVKHGAPENILTKSKPHIGTDKLRAVIKSMRNSIIENGGQVYFHKKLNEISIENNCIKSIVVDGQEMQTENVILAIGHSSRDTFQMLFEKGVNIESKNFSVGVRIEQLQTTINRGLYGELAGHKNLPVGEYQLSHKIGNQCVYTFCMCPGGYVVPSSSSENSVVVNGMSEYARDGKNSNSALVVSVDKSDFGLHPLDGMHFQAKLEQKAFQMGGGKYKAPAMSVKEFINQEHKLKLGEVNPTYALGVESCNFDKLFPSNISKMLRIGLQNFNTKLPGFSNDQGILTGVETRTSSPIRVLRNDELMSTNVKGLYPCGEGAGYAGGIMSAAVDGIKVAQQIASKYKQC
ncbi:NAD(P)/FAD-dependent oxidoreductase [Paludicola sp. MB14-C6]|uniref:NAD(P)/FAD-dependent oxidoreductase n=1 Tax=Paludihabitans sp. MB14-C6 TaxID=3070656 RepID=UPI0027DE4EFC|nr:NAD(P)/FAD-dependent oxidoreductase [Paludicola sp. MB14-C6]WMJ23370.1 NAD(P)/FAD-dependent oxidoreductase [Paludicola sp. MB14-C6]